MIVKDSREAPAGRAALDQAAALRTIDVDEPVVVDFIGCLSEHLDEIETLVLNVEVNHTTGDLDDLMRFFHNLKGESALLGFEDVSRLAHRCEDMLQTMDLTACVDQVLEVKDWLSQLIEHLRGVGEPPPPVAEVLATIDGSLALEARAAKSRAPAPCAFPDVLVHDLDVEMLRDFIGETAEHLDAAEAKLLVLEADALDEEALNSVFRAFHTIKGVAGFVDMEHIQQLAHKAEHVLEQARGGGLVLKGPAMDLIFETLDALKNLCGDVTRALAGDGVLAVSAAVGDLMARLDVLVEDGVAPATGAGRRPHGEDAPGLVVLRKPIPPAVASAEAAPAAAVSRRQGAPHREAVRVDADRLDLMVDTIGELVIAAAMIGQDSGLRASQSVGLLRNLDHLDKICRELQQIGMSLRMVPVRPTFQKMARLVRDLASRSSREIEFVMTGEDTELDKSVVDKIGDPLVHMLRNAVDHGIESDERERRLAGKPACGRIELRAFHKGGNIIIEVEDDGRGLDREAILAKAVERGLVKEGAVLGDREVFALIFEPGFSTAKQVTDVSGRGVGMDVVRRNVEELRGTVEISSQPGRGSVFRFKLPLTLAIIDGMVVLAGGERFIIPTLNVVRLVRPGPDDYSTVLGRGEMLDFEGDLIPLARVHRLFSVKNARENLAEAVVVVVESDGRRVGLLTDDLVGQQQIVIKNLGDRIQGTEGLAGGAIMSDGNVALIIDIAGLVKLAHAEGGLPGAAKARH